LYTVWQVQDCHNNSSIKPIGAALCYMYTGVRCKLSRPICRLSFSQYFLYYYSSIHWKFSHENLQIWLSWLKFTANFHPLPQNRHHWTDHQKFVTGDYVGDPSCCTKFGACKSVHGGLLDKWVKHSEILKPYLFIYRHIPLFRELTYRSDPSTDFHDWYSSNDADSRKDVAFGGFVDIAPHFRGKIPQKQCLGVRRCQAKRAKYWKFLTVETVLHRFQPNLVQRETTK